MNTPSSKILKFLIYLMIVGIVIIMLVISYRLRAESDQSKKEAQQLELKHDVLASPTPIKPISSCLILEEKYCKQYQLIKDPWDDKGLLALFKLPKGTIIYSPVAGSLSTTPVFFFKDNDKTYPGATISTTSDHNLYSFIYYDENKTKEKSSKTNINSEIGRVSTTTIDYLGDYNLVFQVLTLNTQEKTQTYINSPDKLKKILNVKNE